jgi:hypothetical protein
MSLHGATGFIGPAQSYNGCVPYRIPSEPVKETRPLTQAIAESNTVQEDYLEQLIRLLNLASRYSEEDYTASMLSSGPSISEPVIVRPPKKRVLASMRVRLASTDFKRRLPRPVISLRSEVEP